MGVYALSNPNINLLSLLTENKDSKFNLLDVGCYDGSNLKVLRQQYINSNLYGVDIDNTVLSYADQYGSTYCVDIEKNTFPFQHNFFDYILCGDVLEHLHNPVLVLNNLKLFLKDDGMFIISLPNLMHVSVLFQLLNGRFVYEDAGLLDKTHIHFFTYYEILNMFKECGLDVVDARCFKYDLSTNEIELIDKLMTIKYEGVERFMFETYQYYFLCKKS